MNYLIDPTFTNVNRLFVLSFQRIVGENNTIKDYRDSFSHYYVPNVEIKDFNILTDGKGFFDLPVKNEEETYENIIKMSNNNDYTTGNLLHFAYFKKNCKLIAIDLSKQTIHRKLILLENLIKIMERQCSLLLKNQKKLLFIFHNIFPQLYK